MIFLLFLSLTTAASVQSAWAKLQSSMPRFSTSVGASHPSANRYSDVLPFDESRVVVAGGEDDDDYINASWIASLNAIAAQGPLPTTLQKFLLMLWQHDVSVVVTLGPASSHQFEPFWESVPRLSERKGDWIERELVLTHDGQERLVVQLHFHELVDHGVPRSASVFAAFVRRAMELRGAARIAVHCSAGIGRTGMFLLVLAAAERGVSDVGAVAELLAGLRRDRMGLVQNAAQFEFAVHAIGRLRG